MRTYETIFIVHPEVAGDDYTAAVEKFKGVLTEQGGEILNVDEWGTRKLAYPIKKQGRGTYVMMIHRSNPEVISELERRMRIDDKIMKFQTVYLEKGYTAPVSEVKEPAESEAPVEAPAEAEAEKTEENA